MYIYIIDIFTAKITLFDSLILELFQIFSLYLHFFRFLSIILFKAALFPLHAIFILAMKHNIDIGHFLLGPS